MSTEYKTTVEKKGRMYLQRWKITDEGNHILLSEENIKRGYETDPESYFPATCRLCGQTWCIPVVYRDAIENGWECSYCKRGIGSR